MYRFTGLTSAKDCVKKVHLLLLNIRCGYISCDMHCPNEIHKCLYSASRLYPHVMQRMYLTEVLTALF